MTDIYKKGTMTFTNKWTKPTNMSMKEWLLTDKGRTWVSKRKERPSQFIARILKGLPEAVTEDLITLLGAKR